MKCYECMVNFEPRCGDIATDDRWVGTFLVHNLEYLECPECHKILFPYESAGRIDMAKREKRDMLVARLPIGDFVSVREAIKILDITKQAFHKNQRIKRGYIYAKKIGDRWFYNKKSVKLFHKTNDGRFVLPGAAKTTPATVYIIGTETVIERDTQESDCFQETNIQNFSDMRSWDTIREKIFIN